MTFASKLKQLIAGAIFLFIILPFMRLRIVWMRIVLWRELRRNAMLTARVEKLRSECAALTALNKDI